MIDARYCSFYFFKDASLKKLRYNYASKEPNEGNMQNLYYEVDSLDKRACEQFHMSEDLLMEHAANGMASYIHNHYPTSNTVLIVSGSGNNGADGIALARLLHLHLDVRLYLHKQPSTSIGQIQLQRLLSLGIKPVDEIEDADIIVDALFGSGLSRELDQESSVLIEKLNCLKGTKIACDMPSGLNKDGHLYKHAFVADVSLCMGGIKRALFTDKAKEYVGKVQQIDLGMHRDLYENESNWRLLDKSDLKPPYRTKKNTHKGSFGHLALVRGSKEGAAIISALSAFSYGAGLVSLVGHNVPSLPYSIMQDEHLPENATAIACGMGLGKNFQRERLSPILSHDLPMVLDADIFYHSIFYDLLHKELIITPHPKEFVHILATLGLAQITVQELQEKRFHYAELFSTKYPKIVLILKGANTIIVQNNNFYINPHGTPALAKGGSGDVLTGLCGALLAQGYNCLEAAIQASLAQTLSASSIEKSSYALTPEDIIKGLSCL